MAVKLIPKTDNLSYKKNPLFSLLSDWASIILLIYAVLFFSAVPLQLAAAILLLAYIMCLVLKYYILLIIYKTCHSASSQPVYSTSEWRSYAANTANKFLFEVHHISTFGHAPFSSYPDLGVDMWCLWQIHKGSCPGDSCHIKVNTGTLVAQQLFWLVTAGKTQVELIKIMRAQCHNNSDSELACTIAAYSPNGRQQSIIHLWDSCHDMSKCLPCREQQQQVTSMMSPLNDCSCANQWNHLLKYYLAEMQTCIHTTAVCESFKYSQIFTVENDCSCLIHYSLVHWVHFQEEAVDALMTLWVSVKLCQMHLQLIS